MRFFKMTAVCFTMIIFFCAGLFASEDLFESIRKGNTFSVQNLANKETVKSKNKSGETPLQYAAQEAVKPDIINILVTAGADIEERNKNGYTPLMLALRKNSGFPGIAIALIENKADVNARRDETLVTPLMIALNTYSIQINVLRALIDYGADINAQNRDGQTPLMIAARERNAQTVKFLIENKANLKAKDKSGKTAADYVKNNSSIKEKDLSKL